jgi:diguanylate cyclase (GGDEF)-like protein
MSTIEELLKHDLRLPSPPAIAVRIVDLVKRDDFSFKQLAAIIESDPALVARILRLANSGFYGVPRTINSIDKAIAILGVNSLKNIALSFVLSEAFRGKRGAGFDFDLFARRAVTAAVASQLISTEIRFYSDETFITSLLQDIGVAAMFMADKDEYVNVLNERLVGGQPLSAVETQTFGYSHQEVGAELLKLWGLPESVYLPIRYHHETRNVPPNIKRLCSIIRASDRLSALYWGSSSVKNIQESREMLSRTFGLTEDRFETLIDCIAEKSRWLLAQFDIAPGAMRPASEILQEANQELGRLNLSYEMQLVTHKESERKAERLARELKSANERLSDLAFHDDLTGLHNSRYFNGLLEKETARSRRYHRPLSLILLDIDAFKNVNDTYGHRAGDHVLQAIANDIQRNTRQTDTVIRYAGDEFVLLLPETDQAGALAKAEACRANIEALRIHIKGNAIQVTISAGVASFRTDHACEPDSLLDAADRALYQSKQTGRNCVTHCASFSN